MEVEDARRCVEPEGERLLFLVQQGAEGVVNAADRGEGGRVRVRVDAVVSAAESGELPRIDRDFIEHVAGAFSVGGTG